MPWDVDLYEKYRAILQTHPGLIADLLVLDCLPDPENSKWALLRASVAFDFFELSFLLEMAFLDGRKAVG